jgi:hypothetical protein
MTLNHYLEQLSVCSDQERPTLIQEIIEHPDIYVFSEILDLVNGV